MAMTGSHASAAGRAGFLVLAAMAIIGLIDNLIQLIAPAAGLWQFHALRAGAILLVLAPVLLLRGGGPRNWRAVIGRSALASTSMILYFGCLGFMPVALVAAGLFTAPLWLVLYQALLGRRPTPGQMAAVALGFAGVLVMLWPADAAAVNPWLLAVPIAAGAAYGGGNLLTRLWCAGETPQAMLAVFFGFMGLWGLAGLALLPLLGLPVPEGTAGWPLRGWVAPWPGFWGVVLAQAAGSIIAVGMTLRAYQIGEPAKVAVLENAFLVFAALWALALYGAVPSLREVVGMAMILLAGFLAR